MPYAQGMAAYLRARGQKANAIELWQGASVPTPVITQFTDTADAVVFGLTDDELAALLERFTIFEPFRRSGADLSRLERRA